MELIDKVAETAKKQNEAKLEQLLQELEFAYESGPDFDRIRNISQRIKDLMSC